MICILKTHTIKLEFKRSGSQRPKVSNTSYKAQAAAARQQSRAQANEI